MIKKLILLLSFLIQVLILPSVFSKNFAMAAITHNGTSTYTATVTSQVTTGSIPGGSNILYIATIANRNNRGVTSISGLGLTWTKRKSQCSGRNQQGIEIWTAFGSPFAGSLTVNFNSSTNSTVIAVSRYSFADPITPIENTVGANSNGQQSTVCSGGTDGGNVSLNNLTTLADSIIFAGTNSRNTTITTADASYQEKAVNSAGISGDMTRLYVHDRLLVAVGSDVTNHTLSNNTDWSMAGLIIRPLAVPSLTPTPAATLTPTLTATPTQIPIGPNMDQVNAIYSYSGLGYYTLSPTFDGNRTNNKDMTIFLISGSLEIPADFSMSDPSDSVIFIVNGNIFVNGNVTRIPGVYISSQTFTVAPSENPIVIDGMVYANKINLGRTYYSLAQPTYQIIYQPKYIIDLLPYLGRPQVNWQEVIQ